MYKLGFITVSAVIGATAVRAGNMPMAFIAGCVLVGILLTLKGE